jgi:acylphosphatase
MRCTKCIITGRVQGVGFRWSVKRKATELGLTGHAANLSDGTVELLLCGDESVINELLNWLENEGPVFANVKKVECEPITPQKIPDTFETK